MLIKDFKVLWQTIRREGFNLSYFLSFAAQKAVYLSYLLVLPLLLSGQPSGTVILGFVLMHLVQSIFLLFTFFMTHHVMETAYPGVDDKGVIQTSWLMNQVRSSNDMHPFSEVANFILGGFNNHIAHHLFPHIHHLYYPRLNRILYRILESHGISPNQTTYLSGVVSHLKLLKKLSTANQLTT
jgi:linoleoyl-CoA desaturase